MVGEIVVVGYTLSFLKHPKGQTSIYEASRCGLGFSSSNQGANNSNGTKHCEITLPCARIVANLDNNIGGVCVRIQGLNNFILTTSLVSLDGISSCLKHYSPLLVLVSSTSNLGYHPLSPNVCSSKM